ncbi:MAG TPA: hypothetical protein VGN37_08430 [Actinocatenispora sp.]
MTTPAPDSGSAQRPPTAPVLGAPAPATEQRPEQAAPAAEEATDGRGTVLGQSSTDAGAHAATYATADPLAAAAPEAPPGPPVFTDKPQTGRVYSAGTLPRNGEPPAPKARPFPALRIGAHLVNDTALAEIRPAAARSGLVLGIDQQRQPVTVRLFRPEPTRAVLVGGLWMTHLLVLRALSVGARVAVFTARPEVWQGFSRWATGDERQVAVLPPTQYLTVPAGRRTPALLVYDEGPTGASQPLTPTGWQTRLTVLPELTSYGFSAVQEADFVAVQRLSQAETGAATSVMGLPPEATGLLPTLRDDMLALLGDDGAQYLWLCPTTVEQTHLGAPRR